MTRILLLAALVALAACSPPILPAPVAEPETPVLAPSAPEHVYTAGATAACTGDGDGIGGTGCHLY